MCALFGSSFTRLPATRKFDYKPRYYDIEAEERKEMFEGTIKLERGAFFKQSNRSKLVGAFTEREIIYRQRNSGWAQLKRVLILVVILCLGGALILGKGLSMMTDMEVIFGALSLFLLMIFFSSQARKV